MDGPSHPDWLMDLRLLRFGHQEDIWSELDGRSGEDESRLLRDEVRSQALGHAQHTLGPDTFGRRSGSRALQADAPNRADYVNHQLGSTGRYW